MVPGEKYEQWQSRLLISLVGFAVHLLICGWVCDYLDAPSTANYYYPKTGLCLIGYLCIAFLCRFFDAGSFVLLELMWFCNLALFEAGLGMLTGRPLLVGAGLVTVLTDQLCWSVDCLGFLCTGKFVIGAAKYLTWPSISLARKVTSFHHLWFFPVCFYTLQYKLPPYSWGVSCLFTLVGLVYCRFCTPRELNDGKHTHYLNVNGAFEFWKDVPIGVLHRWDYPKASAIRYLTFLFCFGNTVNFILSFVFF